MTAARILVVEDEPHVARDIQLKLENCGYRVIDIVSNGEAALQVTEKHKPDLVLMDIILEGPLDGIDTAQQIVDKYNIPIIYLTAHAEEDRLQRATTTEPFAYVLKPVHARELHAAILLALHKAESVRQMQQVVWTNAALMSICDAVITLDSDGHISEINPAAASLLGQSPAAAKGMSIDSLARLVDRSDDVTLGRIITDVLASGAAFNCEKDALLEVTDGTRTPVHFSISPIVGPNQNTLGTVCVIHNDSARWQAERDLQESEHKFRTFAESTDSPIMVYRDRILYANRAAEAYSGYSQHELLNMKLLDLVHPDDRQMLANALQQRLMGDSTTGHYQIKFLTKSSTTRVLDISAAMIDYEGEPAGMASGHDVTHLIEKTKALHDSEQQIKAIINNTSAAVYIKDLEGRHLLVNQQYERILGLSQQELLGKRTHDLFAQELADRMSANDIEVAAASGPIQYEEQALQVDGSHDYISIKMPLHDLTGKVYAICGISTDITEQKRRERGLNRISNCIQQLLATATDVQAFYRITCEGIIDLVGADIGALPCLNLNSDSFTYRAAAGKHADMLLGKSMLVEGGGLCGWVAKHGETLRVADLFADARVLPELARALEVTSALVTPLLHDTIVIGGLTAFRSGKPFDTIDQELLTLFSQRVGLAFGNQRLLLTLEQRVAERTRELEITNAELEAFSYSVSHDLRAPLRSINGFSKALREDYADTLDEQGLSYLQRISNSSVRMGLLIDDLLMLSRVSSQGMHLQDVDLSLLANTVIKELSEQTPDRQVETIITPGLSVIGDLRLLQIVLTNLLGNAWKFTRKTANARIEFGIENYQDKSIFRVRDNGAGFDMTYADKLFKPFQRLHSDQDFEGIGIGLATVRRIIQRHHGNVWAEGKPGAGATIYFCL